MSISLAPFHPTAPRLSQSWYHLECRRDPRLYQRYEGGSLVGPSPHRTRNTTEEQGPQGMEDVLYPFSVCPSRTRMTTMATDDDRRDLSPSGSHYVSNLQATTAGDGGRLRRRTSRIPSPFPVLQSSGEDRGARAEGMSFFCVLFNTVGLKLTSHF